MRKSLFTGVILALLTSPAWATEFVYNEYIAHDTLTEPKDRNDNVYEYKVVEFADRDTNLPKVVCITRGRSGISCNWGGYNKEVQDKADLEATIRAMEWQVRIQQIEWQATTSLFEKLAEGFELEEIQ